MTRNWSPILSLTLIQVNLVAQKTIDKLFHLYFQSSKLTHNSNNLARELEDTEVAQLRQRRLSQPFAWHQDNEKNEKNSINLLSEPDLQNSAEGTTPEKETNSSDVIKAVSPSTCRNSVQGQIYIADDRGMAKRIQCSQLWFDDHLRITTTCVHRPPFWGPIFNLRIIYCLWTTTRYQQRPQILGLEGGRCSQVWV
jgi:hypothetical protein